RTGNQTGGATKGTTNRSNQAATANGDQRESGLGSLCSSRAECATYCFQNQQECLQYCRNNPGNSLCQSLSLGGSGGSGSSSTSPDASGTPVIGHLGVDFDDLPASAGDEKVFLEVGMELTNPNGTKLNPAYEYRPVEGAEVYAVANGTVRRVHYQPEDDDYSILIRPTNASGYVIDQDHIKNPEVERGDTVEAGQVLGTVGSWHGKLGRTEVDVSGVARGAPHYCPAKFFAPAKADAMEQVIWNHITSWEETKGDETLYPPKNDFAAAGCRNLTLDVE
ncbi:MAG: M23 family metallopeptidase, partial [Candidatus Nanohaloarchaea archaeon]|nr:M23 family metallopeptidase [Candidatus Nanohaloarchaea archaeon]